MPRQIIVADEKEGRRYLAADTPEQLDASALKLLTERRREGYWYLEPDEMFDAPAQSLTDEQIEALPTDSLKNQARRDRSRADQDQRERTVYTRWWDAMIEITDAQQPTLVANKNGVLQSKAWRLLRERDPYEYESVELETVEVP